MSESSVFAAEPPDPTALTRLPPHSLEAEEAVLGGLMRDNVQFDRMPDLKDSDFYRSEHRQIYRVMQQLIDRHQSVDVLMVAEELESLEQLDQVGGTEYLVQLAANTPAAANVPDWAGIIIERSILRQLIAASHEISESCLSPQGRDSKSLLDEAESRVFEIGNRRRGASGPVAVNPLLKEVDEKVREMYEREGALTGLSSGYHDLDAKTAGLQAADLIVIAGRPSMGKTSLAMNIAENAVIHSKVAVLVFSMEMPASSIIMRMLSSLGRIEQSRIRTGKLHDEDWPRFGSARSMLEGTSLFVDDTAALTPGEIRARARRLVREHRQPLGLIVVDYLQLMQVSGTKENRTGEISEISRSLKAIAKEFDCPVIALSQLNRALEQRPDKRPVMSDLRESGAIEQDADVIIGIYRDEVYNEESAEKGVAEILILKQRNGPIGSVKMTFLGKYTRFEDFAHGYADDNNF